MSVSGVSSVTNPYQNSYRTQVQQAKKDFTALKTSLTSGDLTGAQSAFATLMQDVQGMSQTQTAQQTGGINQIGADLTALGNALQSGDLTAAQKAYSTLTQDVQGAAQSQAATPAQGHHHHHHHGSSTQDATAATGAATTSDDLTALGNALQSGDLTAAQKAYATLMKDMTQNTATASGTSGYIQSTASAFDITV